MKHAYEWSRSAAVVLGLACAASLPASCATQVGGDDAPDAAIDNVDPTGNWNITYSYDAGCGQQAGSASATFTVTLSSTGYAVTAAGVTTTGTLICDPAACKLSGMFLWSASGAQYQQNANLSLDPHGAIAGNGTESVVTATMTCSFAFKAQGMRS